MKRYPAFDPPEYIDWRPDPAVMDEFRTRLTADAERAGLIRALTAQTHMKLYAGLVRNRLHDIFLKRWVKQGVLSKAWLGTGEEAATIGAVHALEPGDQVGPMIRNAGACHEMGMSLADMLRAYLGTYDTITRGRDLHTGDPARGVIPPISMVAALTPVMAGIALAFRMRGQANVALTWNGDGATRTGEFHEGVTLAAAQRLPVIFVIQNNQVALGTALAEGVAGDLRELHQLYGVPGLVCDGNNVLDVYAATRIARHLCVGGEGPVLLVAETFRMGGHATHDEAEARALFRAETFAHWAKRDPIGMYETWLVESGPMLARVDPALDAEARDLPAESLTPAGVPNRGDPPGSSRRPAESPALAAVHDRAARAVDPETRALPEASVAHAHSGAPDLTGGPQKARSRATKPSSAEQTIPAEVAQARADQNRRVLSALEARVTAELETAAEEALRSRDMAQPPPHTALDGVYAPSDSQG